MKRLEAYGFKSFADRIEIEFDKGITAIVGPNGSGKSNITDAIRWVLGEQNIRNLRGSKAEDIIFTGSSVRKASGIAEVSLTFDNIDGKLPLEFQEINIIRRLFRSGESEFYINKARCRLKDIYTLFADTGLGKDSISVISQNKVDEVLNARPENRRLLFEECAGITKYRDRKKEAVRKLENTEQNAVRINDIITEISKQLTPLAAEAEKTQRYNQLKNSYDRCKLSHILCKYENFSTEDNVISADIQKLKTNIADLEIKKAAVDGKTVALDNEITIIEKQLADMESNNRKIAAEIERNRSNCRILAERIKQNSHSLNILKDHFVKITTEKTTAEDNLVQLQVHISELAKTKLFRQTALEKTHTTINGLEKNISDEQNLLDKLKTESHQKQLLLEQQERKLIMFQRDIEEKMRSLAEKKTIKDDFDKNKRIYAEKIAAAEQEITTLTKKENCLQTAGTKAINKYNDIQSQLHIIQEKCTELTHTADRTKERIKILSNMQKAYEGFGKSVKAVLTAQNQAWYSGICGSVAELIKVAPPYITAIETALGNSLQNIITTDTDIAKAAISFLKREKSGRATFLPITTVKPYHLHREDMTIYTGFIGYADQLISTQNQYEKIIESLLGRTVIVDNIDNALILAKQKKYTLRIVTLAGEIMHAGGAMSGGSTRREISFLNRENDIQQLITKNNQLISQLLSYKTKQSQLMSDLSKTDTAIKSNNKQLQDLFIIKAEKKTNFSHLRDTYIDIEKRVTKLISDISSLDKQSAELHLAYDKEKHALDTERTNKNIESEKSSKIEEKIAAYHCEQKKQQAQLLKQTAAFASIEESLSGNREKLELLKNECHRCCNSLKSNTEEQTRLQNSINDSLQELAQLQLSTKNLQQLHQSGSTDYDKTYSMLMTKRVKNKEYATKRKETADQMSTLQEHVHALEIKAAKTHFEVEQCVQRLQEDYALSPQEALSLKEDIPEEILLKNLKELQEQLTRIGSINPNAINEYNEINKRHKFMAAQMEDLTTAKADLQQIITQMDLTMSKQFKKAFISIQEYFNDIFGKLFGGGTAKLILTDEEDILSSGVEIAVQTPGKKKQNLVLLSGGERTLTVIALLFSFLQYSPAPFSVLDEIDAPLDEVNIKRFSAFLKDYSSNTQFIIVTHRKGTMEAADVMYGVTMEEAGVSKIISVKLEESEA
nr:chromosome segregation protein SMC [Pectinatus sottacetonis]